MNIPIFSKFFSTFSKHKRDLPTIDSLLMRQLKKVAEENEFDLFENCPIFYRSSQMEAPLAIFIPNKGIVLFEYKEWSFEELKDLKASKASHAKTAHNTLSFENINEFIKEKFLDLSGFEDIDIFNFLLMEQLSEEEFDHLDSSFHEVLPKERILFSDSSQIQIKEKLLALEPKRSDYTRDNTLPYIFSQYMIIEKEILHFATPQQREIIDSQEPSKSCHSLHAPRLSGKSTVLLQKALLKHLREPEHKIAIIAPTLLHVEQLRHLLLALIERSALVIEMNAVDILSADELIRRHSHAIGKKTLSSKIERFHFTKDFYFADTLYIDDSDLMENEFTKYIKKLQKKRSLLLVNSKSVSPTCTLEKTFHKESHLQTCRSCFCVALRTLYDLVDVEKEKKSVLLFTHSENKESIAEDIQNFTGMDVEVFDMQKPLHEQKSDALLVCEYSIYNPLQCDYAIFLEPCESDAETLNYLNFASREKSFFLSEQECDTISFLEKKL